MAPDDQFAFFQSIVNEMTPWLRARGFTGSKRSFQMELPNDCKLLVSFKTSKWNRRDRETFEFLLEAYIMDKDGWLTWYWKSSTDGGGRRETDDPWETVTATTDFDELTDYLKTAVDTILLPAAQHEIESPSSPSRSGTRIPHVDDPESA